MERLERMKPMKYMMHKIRTNLTHHMKYMIHKTNTHTHHIPWELA